MKNRPLALIKIDYDNIVINNICTFGYYNGSYEIVLKNGVIKKYRMSESDGIDLNEKLENYLLNKEEIEYNIPDYLSDRINSLYNGIYNRFDQGFRNFEEDPNFYRNRRPHNNFRSYNQNNENPQRRH